jgi:TonB family protein
MGERSGVGPVEVYAFKDDGVCAPQVTTYYGECASFSDFRHTWRIKKPVLRRAYGAIVTSVISSQALYRLDSYSMMIGREWRHVREFACMLALIFSCLYRSYLYGQDSPATARAVIRKVQPQYPALAQRMSIKGSVKLEVFVEPDGSVKSLNTKGGHPVLAQAAQDAIRQWKWQAASHETVESVEVRFNPQ